MSTDQVNPPPSSEAIALPIKRSFTKLKIGIVLLILTGGALGYYLYQGVTAKTHSVITFSTKEVNQINNGDILTGKGIPDSTTQLIFSPGGGLQEIKVNQDGDWLYRISGLESGIYTLSVIMNNKDGDLVSIKNYKLQADGFNPISYIKKIFLPKQASAQGVDYDWQRLIGPDWGSWLEEMHALDIYPAIENGEVFLYSQTEYRQRYCQSQQCNFEPRSFQEWSEVFDEEKDFFFELKSHLVQNDYRVSALEPYFPQFSELIVSPYGNPDLQATKTEIDEETLSRFINEVAIQRGYAEKDLFKNVLNTTEILVPTRSIYNVVSGYELVNTDDKINATFGLLAAAPYLRIGGALAGQVAGKSYSALIALNDARVLRQTIAREGFVRFELIAGRAKAWYRSPALPPSKYRQGLTVVGEKNLPPVPEGTYGRSIYDEVILPAVRARSAFSISVSDVTRPAAENVKRSIRSVEAFVGEPLPINEAKLNELVSKGHIFVVPEHYFRRLGNAGGVNTDSLIAISEDMYNSARGLSSISHEMWHSIGQRPSGFIYKGSSDRDRTFTILYELMTEVGADLSTGVRPFSNGSALVLGGYGVKNSYTVRALERLLSNPEIAKKLYKFSVTGDAHQLTEDLIGSSSFTRFSAWLQRRTTNYSLVGQDDFAKLKAFLERGAGVNLNAISFAGIGAGGAATNELLVEPLITIDENVSNDDYDTEIFSDNTDAIIVEVDGAAVPGGELNLGAVVTINGVNIQDPSLYEVIWTIEPDVNQNTFQLVKPAFAQVTVVNSQNIISGGERCQGSCKVILPSDLKSGKYKITANVVKRGTQEVLSSDSYSITVSNQNTEPKRAISVKIGSIEQNLENPQAIKFSLKDNPFVSTEVRYSDGTSKFITLKFEPLQKGGAETITQAPSPTQAVSNPAPVTINAPVPGTTWSGYGIDAQGCGSKTCKPINLRSECKDGRAYFYWTRMDKAYYQIRVDNLSNPWPDSKTDVINDFLTNGVGYQGPDQPNFQVYPVKDGDRFRWWLHMGSDKGISDPVDGPPIYCGNLPPTPTITQVGAQDTKDYCPNGVCSSLPNGFIATCTDNKLKVSWPVQPNAKFYLVRIDKDPDSWNGKYNPEANPGDVVWDSPNIESIVNGLVKFGGDVGWPVEVGHNYKIWIHPAYDEMNYYAPYKGRFGSRIDGGTVTCH